MTLAYLPGQVIRPLLLILGIVLLSVLGGELDQRKALGVTAGAYFLAVLSQGAVLERRVRSEVGDGRPEYRTRRWLRISLPMLLIAGFILLLNRTDVVMLGALAEARDVGTYNAAARTANLTTFVLMAVNAMAAPSIAPLFRKGEHERLQDLASTVAHLTFWPSLAVGVGLVGLAPYILGLFGEAFVAGHGVLAILVVGHLVNVGVGSVGYLMNMTGNQDEMARVVGSAAVVNILLNALLIPRFGALGAGMATATSTMVWNVWLNRIVVSRISIHPSIVHAVRRFVAERQFVRRPGGD
jgi:O-antigen/teichoic acid export membrane protein